MSKILRQKKKSTLFFHISSRKCLIYLGKSTLCVLAWKLTFADVVIPRLLQASLNRDTYVAPGHYNLKVILHWDAVGQETMISLKALNPPRVQVWYIKDFTNP